MLKLRFWVSESCVAARSINKATSRNLTIPKIDSQITCETLEKGQRPLRSSTLNYSKSDVVFLSHLFICTIHLDSLLQNYNYVKPFTMFSHFSVCPHQAMHTSGKHFCKQYNQLLSQHEKIITPQ